jgi:uncharacterized small protein (DUF1192 family)
MKSFLFSPDDITRLLEEADQGIGEKQKFLQSLEQEHDKVSREMKKVYRAYVEDQLAVEAFGREYRPLEARVAALEDEIPRVQAEVDFLRIQLQSSDQVLSNARDLHAQWPHLSMAEKQQIVEDITESVTIGKDEVAIELSYLPVPAKKNSKAVTPFESFPKKKQIGNTSLPLRFCERLQARVFLHAPADPTLHVEDLRSPDGSHRHPDRCPCGSLQGTCECTVARVVGDDPHARGGCTKRPTPEILR